MKITFKKITIQNFMSFREEVIQLDDRGYVRVSGKNKCDLDKAYSNGSGKSSIWESISWCLTGQTIRGTKEITNFYGDDGALVSLDIEVDNVPYTITRTKDHSQYKTSLKIIRDGEDVSGKGIRDTEQLLAQYFPDLTSTLIGSVILLGQGLPQRFSNNTPSGRKEVLESLSKSDFMIDDIKQRLSERINFINGSIADTKNNISIDTGKCDYLKTQRASSEDALNNLPDISDLTDEQTELNGKIQEIEESIRATETDLDWIKKERDRTNELGRTYTLSLRSDTLSINSEFDSVVTTTRNALALVVGELARAKSELQRVKSIKDTCPTCGQRLQGIEKPDITPYEEEVRKLESSHKNLQDSVNVVESERSQKLKECETKHLQMIDDINASLRQLDNNISGFEKSNQVFNADLVKCRSRLEKINSDIMFRQQVQKHHEDIIQNTTSEIDELEQKILYNNMNLNKLEGKLKVLNKINTIVKRDFRGVLLSSIIDYINIKLREYSIEVFDGDNVRIELNGNNLDILYCNKHYESLSGGERQKIDVLIQFAIREMLCNRIGFSSNIIVLDELFDNLDSTGCDKIINLISNKLSDISSIFIITHHTDIIIPSDSVIEVEKNNNGVSKIVKNDI